MFPFQSSEHKRKMYNTQELNELEGEQQRCPTKQFFEYFMDAKENNNVNNKNKESTER